MAGTSLVSSGGYYLLQNKAGATKRAGGFLFKRTLPRPGYAGDCLRMTSSRLLALGYGDFADRLLAGPATYLLRKQGKMIRPSLIFASARLLGRDMNEFVDLAVAGELLHTASLIHDDIIDKDTARRGLPAVHVRYGSETALLAGDALIAKAVELGAKYGSTVVEAMAKTAIDMCAGELLDYDYQKRRRMPDVKTYLRIAKLKSASLIGRCASVVALHAKDGTEDSLMRFGVELGIAFQIRDDILEVIDARERKENGGAESRTAFRLNIIDIIMRGQRSNKKDALDTAVALNNYFADMASASVSGLRFAQELKDYVDFVRIGER